MKHVGAPITSFSHVTLVMQALRRCLWSSHLTASGSDLTSFKAWCFLNVMFHLNTEKILFYLKRCRIINVFEMTSFRCNSQRVKASCAKRCIDTNCGWWIRLMWFILLQSAVLCVKLSCTMKIHSATLELFSWQILEPV